MAFVWFLSIGLLAGFIAGWLTKGGGFGFVGNLVGGVLGAIVGGFLFNLLGISPDNLLGQLIAAHRRRAGPGVPPGHHRPQRQTLSATPGVALRN